MTLEAHVGVDRGGFVLDLQLAVAAGAVIALVGPNGAGKTTALRAISGLEPLARGEISIAGCRVDAPGDDIFVVPERREVGVMFQDYLLFPHLTAVDNIAFGVRARGMRRAQARTRAREWLERFGLQERADAKPGELSGGQAQRVALARALVIEPKVLLLDEPLAALDVGARDEVRRDLRRHLREFAGATVLVSHDPVDAAVLADSIAILDTGRVVQHGPVAEILARPRSRYVADLVGVNLIEGRADGHQVFLDRGGRVIIADAIRGPVQLVIDPRAISLSTTRNATSARNQWSVQVDGVQSIGDRARVRLIGEISLVAEVTASALRDLGLHEGAKAWASVKATEVKVSPQ